MHMIRDEKMNAFLEARTMLPNPTRFNGDVFTISVGSAIPPVGSDYHMYGAETNKTFVFKKCFCKGINSKYEWVCTDNSLQHIISENYLFAALTLYKIAIAL